MADKDAPKGDEMRKPVKPPNDRVKKSPVKRYSPSEEDQSEYCHCSVYIAVKEISVGCSSCSKFWHLCYHSVSERE